MMRPIQQLLDGADRTIIVITHENVAAGLAAIRRWTEETAHAFELLGQAFANAKVPFPMLTMLPPEQKRPRHHDQFLKPHIRSARKP